MSSEERMLIAHLARRAGFGATPNELDRYVETGYEALVEEFLHPMDPPHAPDDLIYRRIVYLHPNQGAEFAYWGYRMITTTCPLEEKIALLWHGVFATGYVKNHDGKTLINQIGMFREHGMGRLDDLLVELSRDPAMIMWLDNHENHKGAINENYGREILELFSMGVGNYTEDDIKECARAFTGWTIGNAEYMAMMSQKDSIWPYGRIGRHFEYRADDHDDGEKVFLGERGRFNGEDVIEIICRQPATARFIARHLYNFFVADEVPVPQWADIAPRDPEAIAILSQAYPGSLDTPIDGVDEAMLEAGYMGQALLQPPSVEGWHTGEEWVTSGALVDRVNFAASHIGNMSNPGVRDMVDRIARECGDTSAAGELVDTCLDVIGPMLVSDDTRDSLIEVASKGRDEAEQNGHSENGADQQRIVEILKMIVSSREYQLC